MPAQQDRAPRRTPPRRPDASMSLLTGLLTETLDPAYAEAAARRKAQGADPKVTARGWHRNLSPTVLLGVAAIALVLVVAAIQTQRAAPEVNRERQQLISRIQEGDRLAATDQEQIDADRAALQAAQAAALGPSSEEGKRFAALSVSTGAVAATGPGMEVVLSDAPGSVSPSGGDIRQQGGADLGRVQDVDLQHAVNGLWAAGAEAIAINGQRLTATSAIRTAGSAILVDFRPLSPPYTIAAIGDPKTMPAAFADNTDGRYLFALKTDYGIVFDTSTKDKLSVPAASQVSVTDAVPVP